MRTIAFIGGGNMASAIIGGLLKSGREGASIMVVDPGDAARTRLASEFGVRTLAQADAALASADMVVWAVKPQFFQAAAVPCAPHVGRALHLSVMAGIRSAAIAQASGAARIVRAMPNTPAQIGQGLTVWTATADVNDAQREQARMVFQSLGKEIQVDDEKYLDMATAVSGTGPTYTFLVLEALIDAAVHLGFARDVAHDIVIETMLGSVLYAQQSERHPAELRNMVTSPGGTSAEAIYQMEKGSLRTVLSKAVWAAYQKSCLLGETVGKTTARKSAAK